LCGVRRRARQEQQVFETEKFRTGGVGRKGGL
jgi:hypothetical protein